MVEVNEYLPAPFTPADCDLRDFSRMMLDIQRLRTSEFDAIADDTAWRAGLNLWMSAFHNVPAASLADGDASFCKAAGLGRDIETWKRVREDAMRGWRQCSDGRWYHATVAEVCLEAWVGKLGQRLASGMGNAAKHNFGFDAAPVKAAITQAVNLLLALNPASKAIPKAYKHISRKSPANLPPGELREGDGAPEGVPLQSQEKGKGIEKGKDKKKDAPSLALGAVDGQKPAAFQIPAWVPAEAWKGFVEMRKKIRHPLTDRAAELIVAKLSKLKTRGHDPAEVLDQSTVKSWRDVFPVKPESDQHGQKSPGDSFPSTMVSVAQDRARKRNPFGLNHSGHALAHDDGAGRGEGDAGQQDRLFGPDDHGGGV